MSIAGVLFPTGTYVVTRTARGAVALGRYTPGPTTTFPIVAGVQPVRGELLRDLPAGMRSEETLVVYTAAELVAMAPAGVDDGTVPDQIEIDGETWRVVRVERFRILARRYRAWVERVRKS